MDLELSLEASAGNIQEGGYGTFIVADSVRVACEG
jgi:hypothetical protein